MIKYTNILILILIIVVSIKIKNNIIIMEKYTTPIEGGDITHATALMLQLQYICCNHLKN